MGSPEKDPKDWVTRDEPTTGPQRSYLETLAREAGEEIPTDLTKAQASELIDRCKKRPDADVRGQSPGRDVHLRYLDAVPRGGFPA